MILNIARCPYCGGRGVVKTSMSTSVELHRTLNTVMRKYQESVHDIRVILNPDILKRLKEEDEELLVELERRYAGKLMFRGDPTFHHEKFLVTDANTPVDMLTTVLRGIQQEFGLKLESKKMPLDFVVIDAAEKMPVEN